MPKCPDKNLDEYKALEESVGDSIAHYLWDKYDGDVPAEEYLKGVNESSTPEDIKEVTDDDHVYNYTISEAEEQAMGWDLEDNVSTAKLKSAVFAIKNRIKSLKESIPNNPNKVEQIKEKIRNNEKEIINLVSEEKLANIIGISKSSLEWVQSNVFNADKLYDNDIIQGIEELSAAESMMSDLLTVDSFDNGEEQYSINNTAITDEANEIREKIRTKRNLLNDLAFQHLADKISEKEGRQVTLDELKTYTDVTKLQAEAMDISRIDDQLVSYINQTMQDANRNQMTHYNELLNKPLKALEKKAGMNLMKESHAREFLQEDAQGNLTLNMLDEYSSEFWSEFERGKREIRDAVNYNRTGRAKGESTLDVNTKVRELLNKLVIADVSKLTEGVSEEVREGEIERLAKEVGREKAEQIAEDAVRRHNRYLENSDNYLANLWTRHLAGEKGLDTKEGLNRYFKSYEERKDPKKIFEALSDPSVDMKDVSLHGLAFAPKRMIDGKDTNWFDKKYERLKNGNPAKFELFQFIKDKFDEYKSYLPASETYSLDRNYLPDIMKESILEDLKGGIGKGAWADRFLKMLSTNDESVGTRQVIGPDGKPKPVVPIRYTRDKVGNAKKAIERAERRMTQIDEIINKKYRDIESKKVFIENHSQASERMSRVISSLEEDIKELKAEKVDIDRSLPGLKRAFNDAKSKKSLDLVQSLRMFGMMAINYKYKAEIADKVAIAQNALHEASVAQVTPLGRVKTDEAGNVQYKTGESNVQKAVDYAIDALVYGRYKSNKGLTSRKVGITKEARQELNELRRQRADIQKRYTAGLMSREDFDIAANDIADKMEDLLGVRNFSGTKVAESLMNYSYLLGIGWNPLSATANIVYGKMANAMEAASGQFFNTQDKRVAEKLLRSSILKSATTIDNDNAKKIRNLINKYGILFDLLEDSYGSNRGLSEKKKRLGFLNGLEMQRRGEYYNQGTVLLAILNHTKVEKTNGEKISLLEAYDSDGEIKEGLLKNQEDWDILPADGKRNKFVKLRGRVLQVNKRLHGNYDPSSPLKGKQTLLGRSLFMFKSWMPEGFATRFEKYHHDDTLDANIKGRYRSYQTLGFKGSVRMLRNILMNRMIKENKNPGSTEEEVVDYQNMKRNLKELQWGLMALSAYLLVSLGLPKKDDEDDGTEFAIRHTLNMIGRLQSDITIYFSPIAMKKMLKNPFPALTTLDKIAKMPGVVYKTMTKDDKQHDADYFLRNIGALIPIVNQGVRVVNPPK